MVRIHRNSPCLLILAILCSINLKGQKSFLQVQVGNGWYAMDQLQDFGDFLVSQNPLDVIENANYPPYPYFQLGYTWNWTQYAVGVALSHQSTGSRYSLMDITGQYIFDTRAKSESLSAFTRIFLIHDSPVKLSFHGGFGGLNTRFLLEEVLEVDKEVLVDDRYNFHALSLFLEGGLTIGYSRSFWELNLVGKYVLQTVGQNLRTSIDGQKALLSYKNKKVNADWSGVRVGLELMINLEYIFGREKEELWNLESSWGS